MYVRWEDGIRVFLKGVGYSWVKTDGITRSAHITRTHHLFKYHHQFLSTSYYSTTIHQEPENPYRNICMLYITPLHNASRCTSKKEILQKRVYKLPQPPTPLTEHRQPLPSSPH